MAIVNKSPMGDFLTDGDVNQSPRGECFTITVCEKIALSDFLGGAFSMRHRMQFNVNAQDQNYFVPGKNYFFILSTN